MKRTSRGKARVSGGGGGGHARAGKPARVTSDENYAPIKSNQFANYELESMASGHYAAGTPMVPGQGGADTVPSMLTPGEAVLTPVASEILGRDTIDRLNAIAAAIGGGGGAQPQPQTQGFAGGTSSVQDPNAQMQQMIHQVALQHGGKAPAQGFADGTSDAQPQMDPNAQMQQMIHQVALQHGGRPPDAMAQMQGGAPQQQMAGNPFVPPTAPDDYKTMMANPPDPYNPPKQPAAPQQGQPQAQPPQANGGFGSRLASELGIGSAQAAPRGARGQPDTSAVDAARIREEGAQQVEDLRGVNTQAVERMKERSTEEEAKRAPDSPEQARARHLADVFNNHGVEAGMALMDIQTINSAIENAKTSDEVTTLMDKRTAILKSLQGKPEAAADPSFVSKIVSGVTGMFGGGGQQQQAAPPAAAPQQGGGGVRYPLTAEGAKAAIAAGADPQKVMERLRQQGGAQ